MGYRYETHLHTCEGSACASASGAEMARAHKEMGYTGIFVTDHFFNGNTAVPRDLPWRERVERGGTARYGQYNPAPERDGHG